MVAPGLPNAGDGFGSGEFGGDAASQWWSTGPYDFPSWNNKGKGTGKGDIPNSAVLAAVHAGNADVNAKLTQIQNQFVMLNTEIAQIRADMVTQTQFLSLEARVDNLERQTVQHATHNPEVQFLRKQLDRLDPGHKCLKFGDFVDKNLASRAASIQTALSAISNCPKFVSIETVHSGKRGAFG